MHQPVASKSKFNNLIGLCNVVFDLPFQDLVEPFNDDDGTQQFDANGPLKSENNREVDSEDILWIKDFGNVHEETFSIGKPFSNEKRKINSPYKPYI